MKSYKHDEKEKYNEIREALRESTKQTMARNYINKVLEDARLYYAAWCRYSQTFKDPPIEDIAIDDVARLLEDFLHFVIDTHRPGVSPEPLDLMKYYREQKEEEPAKKK